MMTITTDTDPRTTTHQLIDAKLGDDGALAHAVTNGRAIGMSWAELARWANEHADTTVTGETLRNWFKQGD